MTSTYKRTIGLLSRRSWVRAPAGEKSLELTLGYSLKIEYVEEAVGPQAIGGFQLHANARMLPVILRYGQTFPKLCKPFDQESSKSMQLL